MDQWAKGALNNELRDQLKPYEGDLVSVEQMQYRLGGKHDNSGLEASIKMAFTALKENTIHVFMNLLRSAAAMKEYAARRRQESSTWLQDVRIFIFFFFFFFFFFASCRVLCLYSPPPRMLCILFYCCRQSKKQSAVKESRPPEQAPPQYNHGSHANVHHHLSFKTTTTPLASVQPRGVHVRLAWPTWQRIGRQE